jgi:hypothetical protein
MKLSIVCNILYYGLSLPHTCSSLTHHHPTGKRALGKDDMRYGLCKFICEHVSKFYDEPIGRIIIVMRCHPYYDLLTKKTMYVIYCIEID